MHGTWSRVTCLRGQRMNHHSDLTNNTKSIFCKVFNYDYQSLAICKNYLCKPSIWHPYFLAATCLHLGRGPDIETLPPPGTFADIYFWKPWTLSFPNLIVCKKSVGAFGCGELLKIGTPWKIANSALTMKKINFELYLHTNHASMNRNIALWFRLTF